MQLQKSVLAAVGRNIGENKNESIMHKLELTIIGKVRGEVFKTYS